MDDASSTDASLLARMAHRDPKALDTFYTRHARAVFSLALTMLREHTRATDLTQEVFLLVWQSAGAYQPTGSARAWLLRLTRNRVIDELRRDRRRLANESVLPQQALHALSAPLALADAAERQAVRDALAALPAEQTPSSWPSFRDSVIRKSLPACVPHWVRLRHAYVGRCRPCGSSCKASRAIKDRVLHRMEARTLWGST
jgi:RNA polymerase sigma factor (sigma-70 family)